MKQKTKIRKKEEEADSKFRDVDGDVPLSVRSFDEEYKDSTLKWIEEMMCELED